MIPVFQKFDGAHCPELILKNYTNSFHIEKIVLKFEYSVLIGAPIVPAKPMRPMFGMNPVLLDDKGNELKGEVVDKGGIQNDEPRISLAFKNHCI